MSLFRQNIPEIERNRHKSGIGTKKNQLKTRKNHVLIHRELPLNCRELVLNWPELPLNYRELCRDSLRISLILQESRLIPGGIKLNSKGIRQGIKPGSGALTLDNPDFC